MTKAIHDPTHIGAAFLGTTDAERDRLLTAWGVLHPGETTVASRTWPDVWEIWNDGECIGWIEYPETGVVTVVRT